MKMTATIMAGGKGERFWPKSRTNLPKQFLSLTKDGETMIQKTANHLLNLMDYEDIFVVTNAAYAALVHEQLPQLPVENILLEPCGRNTAPCIGLAAHMVQKKYGSDAVMLVLPSDHLIRCEELYIDTLRRAADAAADGQRLVTIGITPAYPETGYGYIKFAKKSRHGMTGVYAVECFVEKPNLEKAKEYLSSGSYLWNSGMFVWKAGVILEKLQEHMPNLAKGLQEIADVIGQEDFQTVLEQKYPTLESQSIDFGVMEKASDIFTLPGSFGWDDVGNWLAVERINDTNDYGNYIEGDVITIGTEHTTICGGKRLIAAVGVQNMVIVDTGDAVLICDKEHTQDVKKVLEVLKCSNRSELL